MSTTATRPPSRPEPAVDQVPPSRLGVLRHTHFRNIWFAALVSNTGTWMELLGVQIIVAQETGSLKALGYLGAAQLLPIMLLGIFGGLLADRVNRRTLLIVTQTLLMLVAAALTLLSWLGMAHVPTLFALSIVQGTVMAFNFPAWQVLTPRLVPREELTRAITLNGLQFNAARVIGPALAGFLLARYSPTVVFALNTVTFIAVIFAATRTPDAPPPPRDGSSAAQQIRHAAAFVFHSKGPLCVFIAMVLMSMLAAPLMRMLPLFVIDVYALPTSTAEKTTGLMLATLGLGAVLGAVLLRFVPQWYPKHHFIPLALTGAGLTLTLFSLATALWLGYIAMFFVGIFWIWGFNQSWAAMQNLVADHMRGRVMAISNVAAFGVTALGNIAAGYIGEWGAATFHSRPIGAQLSIGVLSAALLAAGIVMLIYRIPEVDGLKPGEPGYAKRPGLIRGITAAAHRPRRQHDVTPP